MVNLRAIGYGFIVSVVLGLLSGTAVPFTEAELPAASSALVGLFAGMVAGYVTGPDMSSGAVNGAIATTLGAIIGLALLSLIGTALGGLLGAGIFIVGAVLVIAQMIPGAIGGAVGSYLSGR